MLKDESLQEQLNSLQGQSKKTNQVLKQMMINISKINERLENVEQKLYSEKIDEDKSEPTVVPVTEEKVSQGTSTWPVLLMVFGAIFTIAFRQYALGIPLIILGMVLMYNNNKSTKDSSPIDNEQLNEEKQEADGERKDDPETIVKKSDSKKNDAVSFEENLGIKWFARVGILALVIGIGFFIKYAVDMGWISHLARIIMGAGLGIGLIIFGRLLSLKERYVVLGNTLFGGGIAITYFATYAAHHFAEYREAIGMSLSLNIILLSLIVMFSIVSSIRDDSRIIAGEAFFLGYITALLSNEFGILTLLYALFLTIGLITVVSYKKWPILGLGGIIATYIIYMNWYFENKGDFLISLVFLATYFVAFNIQTLFISKMKEVNDTNIVSMLLNSLLFFTLGYSLVNRINSDYVGLFTFILFIVHLLIFLYYKSLNIVQLSSISLYLSLFFLGITVPLEISNDYITLSWAILSLVLFLAYKKTHNVVLKYGAIAISLVALAKTLFIDSWLLQAYNSLNILESTRLWSFIVTIACFYTIYYLLNKSEDAVSEDDSIIATFYSWFALGLLVLIIFLELLKNNSYWITIILALLSLVLIRLRNLDKSFYYQALSISLLLGLKLIIGDLPFLKPFSSLDVFGSERAIAFIAGILSFYAISYYLYMNDDSFEDAQKSTKEIYSYAGTGLLFLLLMVELQEFWISIGWSILALVVMFAGFNLQNKTLRTQGIIIFGITILKVFLIDTRNLETIYRTLSYIILGAILLLVSYLYAKYKDKIKEIL